MERRTNQRILVVEDEPVIGNVCQRILTRKGFTVDVVSDGNKAIDSIHDRRYDLCILDMRMPGMNGAMVYDCLIQIKPDVKVLLFSGFFENRQIQRILKNKNTDLLQKPIRLNHLSEKLQDILGLQLP